MHAAPLAALPAGPLRLRTRRPRAARRPGRGRPPARALSRGLVLPLPAPRRGLTRTQRAGGEEAGRPRPAAGTLRPRRAGAAAARSAAAGLAEDAREEGRDPAGRARGPTEAGPASRAWGSGRAAGVQAERVSLSACPSPDLGVKAAACRPELSGVPAEACQFVTVWPSRHCCRLSAEELVPRVLHPSTRLGASPYRCGIGVPRCKM